MAIEVFKRYEKKFMLDKAIFDEILIQLQEYMELDKYNRDKEFYRIDNIYYDTEHNDLIRRSLDKPLYKEKLRMRSYGVVKGDDYVFLEIKKKYNGLVYKRRTKLLLSEAEDFIRTRKAPALKSYMNGQVLKELEYFICHYEVRPALYLSYDRIAMFGIDNENFRVTLDKNIRTRRYDLGLSYGDYGEQLLDENTYLLEAKTDATYPLWFAHLLNHYQLRSVSFSKYGTEYTRTSIK